MSQKYEAQTFQNVDKAKWLRICEKVKAIIGIDMSNTLGSATSPAIASGRGITISWVYSSETQTLIVDLVKREFFDPGEKEIDRKIAELIDEA
jgi:hypothetical protein